MRPLFTVALPEVGATEAALLDGFIRANSLPGRALMAPHFTLVFGCQGVPEAQYIQHVQAVAKSTKQADFSCKYAMLGADDLDETAYVFLVPDHGFAAVSLMHDRLYSGLLEPFLRLDLPYVPHITIGSTRDRQAAKVLCERLNHDGVHVQGSIRAFTVCARSGALVQPIASVKLREA